MCPLLLNEYVETREVCAHIFAHDMHALSRKKKNKKQIYMCAMNFGYRGEGVGRGDHPGVGWWLVLDHRPTPNYFFSFRDR